LSTASPTFVEFFSGAGGLSLGLKQAGWVPLLALDNWADAVSTYGANFSGSSVVQSDLSELNDRKLRSLVEDRPDWVVGGPPCQGFSTVGRRERTDPRNALVQEFARAVRLLEPAGFLMENVLGLRDMQFVEDICELFRELRYTVTAHVLTAAEYGVPQLRRRIVFVGDRTGRAFLKPRPSTAGKHVTVWEAIGDLPELEPGQKAERYDRVASSSYQKRMREGSSTLQGHEASRHPAYLVRAISFIPDGGNRQSIPARYQPKSGYHNSYSRLHSASPAVAVTQNMGKPSATRCIHPFQDRGLTAREGARLQGFPDRFHFLGAMMSQRLQIANAVPPPLAKALGEALRRAEQWSTVPSEWRQMSLVNEGELPQFACAVWQDGVSQMAEGYGIRSAS